MKIKEWILLVCILLVAFSVRLYKVNNPIADWHAWRQADTSAVSRNFVKHGYTLLYPTYDDISNVQSGKDNPKGYRFVEFPLFNIAQAGLFQFIGRFTLEEWGRIVTAFSTTIATLFIFLLGRRFGNSFVGFFSAAFFAVDPYSIYYGRVILPDPSMVTMLLGGIYFFDKWLSKKDSYTSIFSLQFLFAIVFTAAALLLKPFAGFFIIPFIYIAWKKFEWKLITQWQLWLFGFFSIIPLAAWRIWISHYPEGIPASTWLFNEGNIRFTGAYFYWIFAERVSKLILGYWGIAIVIIGLLNQQKKYFGFFMSLILSTILYIVVVARGNVQHDYYQILIIPTIALVFGLGGEFLFSKAKEFSWRWTGPLVLVICWLFVEMFGWYQIRDYFNINNPALITAGHAVDALTPKDALIVAPYDGDTSFLYQTNRKGWPSFEKSLPELIQMGADYLVLLHPTQADKNLGKTYKITALTDDYILFDLHQQGK